MTTPRQQPASESWIRPDPTDAHADPAYDEWLAAEIEAGCAELDRGESVPAEEVWQALGLE